MNKTICFFYGDIWMGGSEMSLLNFFKSSKDNSNYVVAYCWKGNEVMIEEFKKYVKVVCIEDKQNHFYANTAVNCTIWYDGSEFFDRITADMYVAWLHVSPVQYISGNALDKYDRIIHVSEYIKSITNNMFDLNNKKQCVITPFINKDIKEKALEKQNLIGDDQSYKLITVARIAESKGYLINVAVAWHLKNDFNLDFKWFFIGYCADLNKEFMTRLQCQIKELGLEDNIFIVNSDINPYKYLANCDLNVLMTDNRNNSGEAWGMVITEAKMLAVPSVITNKSGMAEQVTNEIDGLVVDYAECDDDYKYIATKINSILNDKSKYNYIKNNLNVFKYDIEGLTATFASEMEKID